MGIKKTKKTGKLPIIRCICGFEILLLPDLNAMGQAIEEHALRHQNKYSLTEEETDLLKNNLIAQVFDLASGAKDFLTDGHTPSLGKRFR